MTSVHRPFDVRIFEKHCKSMADLGHDVVLVAAHDQDEQIDGVTLRAVPRPSGRLRRMTWTAFQVFREARRQKPDLCQIHDPELLPWANLMRWLGTPVVYDMHENVPKDLRSKPWIPSLLRPLISSGFRVLERFLIGRMPVVFAESSYAKEYPWVRQGVVIQNLAKLESLPAPREKQHDPAVAYIGAVSADRGSWVTLQALKQLKDRGLVVKFECVGPFASTEHESELVAFAKQHDLPVNFHGYLPGAQGLEKIQSCHVGLAVLQPEPNFVGSFPTKLFEYMAMGMPVVVSNFKLYKEVVDQCQCGLCVDSQSPSEIAVAIEQLIRDPERASELGRRGRKAVLARYTWNREMEQLVCFYEQILKR